MVWTQNLKLSTPLERLPGIGKARIEQLAHLGLKTAGDLVFHFPHRYEDFSHIVSTAQAQPGQKITLIGRIKAISNRRTPKKRMLITEALFEDKTGTLPVFWFNQPYLSQTLKPGTKVALAGRVSLDRGILILSNPIYELQPAKGPQISIHTGGLVPIYPETRGLSSRWFRYMIRKLLPLAQELPEVLPDFVRKNQNLLPFQKAITQIHFPSSFSFAEQARKRLAFEELFLLQLKVLQARQNFKAQKSIAFCLDKDLLKRFVNSLAFKLTPSQRQAAWEILQDLQKPWPMNRLLEGDVGTGKTVVAAMIALQVAAQKNQVAFMAPTEILAVQHFETLSKFLRNFGVSLGLLTRSYSRSLLPAKPLIQDLAQERLLEKIKKGQIDIVVGTHSLIQDKVQFKNLALVIVDEQHRFGVRQRAGLIQAQTGFFPHLLSMTATPIPRTLALSIYGNLDLSLVNDFPQGPRKVVTRIVAPANRAKAYQFVRQKIQKGFQAFVICPLIEESEVLQTKAATQEYVKLSQEVFPDIKVGLLHGQLKSSDKEKIVSRFAQGQIKILVATSVVEVGIDIPQATIMIIEGAERFGLAQLYQLRGRIGRGGRQGFCFLFTESSAKATRKRLQALTEINDGFKLSEIDLKLRGPGQFLGTRQWGLPDLSMASLSDLELIKASRQEAERLLAQDSQLRDFPALRKKLQEFGQKIHLE